MRTIQSGWQALRATRRWWVQCAVVLACLALGAARAEASPLLYATGQGSTALSGFYQVDTATGAATLLQQHSNLYL